MVVSIVDVLNQWNTIGVFSYVLPFLVIFAATFGILSKVKLFEENKAVNAIIAGAIGLLALQLDFVPSFFGIIFPRFGVALAVLIVFAILLGFFLERQTGQNPFKDYIWIAITVAVIAALGSLSAWDYGPGSSSIGSWFEDNFWAIAIAIIIGVIIWFIVRTPENNHPTSSDKRLKFDLQKIGVSGNGINIYRFRYKKDPCRVFSGVIAQELLNTKFSNAVSADKITGSLMVDYNKIDVKFKLIR